MGSLLEIAQGVMHMHRTADAGDVIANAAGIGLGAMAAAAGPRELAVQAGDVARADLNRPAGAHGACDRSPTACGRRAWKSSSGSRTCSRRESRYVA